jgi:fatty acid CoA ligase FadD9
MSTGMRDKHLQRRIQGLYSADPQFADARPDNEITVAISRPGLRLAQIAAIVMDGYADQPALGQRAVHFVNDPGTGRTVAELLPRFETITYRDLWERAGAAATAMANKPACPPLDKVPDGAASGCSLGEVGIELGLLQIVDGGVVLVVHPAQELGSFGDFLSCAAGRVGHIACGVGVFAQSVVPSRELFDGGVDGRCELQSLQPSA